MRIFSGKSNGFKHDMANFQNISTTTVDASKFGFSYSDFLTSLESSQANMLKAMQELQDGQYGMPTIGYEEDSSGLAVWMNTGEYNGWVHLKSLKATSNTSGSAIADTVDLSSSKYDASFGWKGNLGLSVTFGNSFENSSIVVTKNTASEIYFGTNSNHGSNIAFIGSFKLGYKSGSLDMQSIISNPMSFSGQASEVYLTYFNEESTDITNDFYFVKLKGSFSVKDGNIQSGTVISYEYGTGIGGEDDGDPVFSKLGGVDKLSVSGSDLLAQLNNEGFNALSKLTYAGNDTISGTVDDNYLDGGFGNDTIQGLAGNDQIFGGMGNDTLDGGEGDDIIDGGAGVDKITDLIGNNTISDMEGVAAITTGAGNDNIRAGNGNNKIVAGDGDNHILAGYGSEVYDINNYENNGLGNNTITTGTGDDFIITGDGNDKITAGDGNNYIDAWHGNNQITTGNGDDVIHGGKDNDKILAGQGNNEVDGYGGNNIILTEGGNDIIYVGNGKNQITAGNGINEIYTGHGHNKITAGDGAAVVDQEGNQVIDAETQAPIILGTFIQAGNGNNTVVTGSSKDKIITGGGNNKISAGDGDNEILAGFYYDDINDIFVRGPNFLGNNIITAGSGNDHIMTASGNDKIAAGNGTNTIDASYGNNTITTGSGNDSITADNGNDIITAGDGINTVNAGDGNNTITTGTGNDNVTTGSGNDKITAGNGDNIVNAGDGANSITTGTGNDNVTAGSGNDKITAGNGDNIINAGDGANTITTGSGNDSVTAGSGDDKITAGDGNNIVHAGSGNDTITAGTGADQLYGEAGNDKIVAGAGDDLLSGGAGKDVLTGGTGADIFKFDFLETDATQFDTIADFKSGEDQLQFDSSVFTALQDFTLDNLLIGSGKMAAETADQHLIYDSKAGKLYYDADGNDTDASAILIASVKGVTADDFAKSFGITSDPI
ncbi:hemolysin [Vogesella alkaliphila]|uniref:Hemolysin n=2 Tax=Vogesella alkaliphila TaxID=1193621 RepID=A0ABQ2Z0F7_9NEIS|nr:hemolysin [Vogesella alkaliphila]